MGYRESPMRVEIYIGREISGSSVDHHLSFDKSPGQRRCALVRTGSACRKKLMRVNSPRRRDVVTSVFGKTEIASAVEHAGEAGQAAVIKHRKPRRKKPKNAAAGDTKVRSPLVLTRAFPLANFSSRTNRVYNVFILILIFF